MNKKEKLQLKAHKSFREEIQKLANKSGLYQFKKRINIIDKKTELELKDIDSMVEPKEPKTPKEPKEPKTPKEPENNQDLS